MLPRSSDIILIQPLLLEDFSPEHIEIFLAFFCDDILVFLFCYGVMKRNIFS